MSSAIQLLESDRRARAEAILEANELPIRGLDADSCTLFGAIVDDTLVAVGGLEQYGPHGLLRSVAVLDPHRGSGYGRNLVHGIETTAGERGVETLYLLTTTAAAFFDHLGYERADREGVPEAIAQTTEFSEICPASAVCMRKRL